MSYLGSSLDRMAEPCARTADEVNAEIRDLFEAGPIDAVRYQQLVVEWAAAMRAEQQLAA